MRECNTTVWTWRIAIRPRSAAKVGRRAHEQEKSTAASADGSLAIPGRWHRAFPLSQRRCLECSSAFNAGISRNVQEAKGLDIGRGGARMGCGCGCGCGGDNRRPWRSVGRGNGNGQSRSLAVSSGHGPVYCPGRGKLGKPWVCPRQSDDPKNPTKADGTAQAVEKPGW